MRISEQIRAHACPCCGSQVERLDVEMLIEACAVSDYQSRILRAVWRGKGYPVPTERIFDAMYADDPDGGPSRSAMYNSFKIALHRLRRRIAGSGAAVENAGYGRGYKIVLNSLPKIERLAAIQSECKPRHRKRLPHSITTQLQLALAAR